MYDGLAVLDRERPYVDYKLAANGIDWFDVSGDRVGKRHALPLVARFTNDRWDTTVGVCDRFDTRLDDGALGSFHGSRRVTQFLQWAAPPPLARVTQAERRELRLAVSSRLSEQRLLPLASGVDAAFVALWWLHAFRLFTTPRWLFDCLVDRFGKPLRRFDALAPLNARLKRLAAQRDRLACEPRSATCSTGGCRHYASDFLADSDLFADCCAFLAQGALSTRARAASGSYSSDSAEALASSGSSDDGGDLLRAQQHKRHAVDERHAHDNPAQGQPVRDDAGGDRHGKANGARVAQRAHVRAALGAAAGAATTACRGKSTSCRAAALRASPPAPTHCVVDLPAQLNSSQLAIVLKFECCSLCSR